MSKPTETISQEILDGIQRIREEWTFGSAPDYSDYLGTGVTAYQFWLEVQLARLKRQAEANELALGMHQERNRW